MKSFDTDLKKYADKVKLRAAERKELRERVLSYMEYHPLPKQKPVSETFEGGILSEKFIRIHLNHFQLRVLGGVFVLLLIVIPIFAERSVPGEVLYILKTGVNEKIQEQLANSPYERIEFETKLMERRIAEARILANEGKLTEETKNQIEENVKNHANAVRTELAELRSQDADSAAIAEITFNSSLEVQSTVLDSTEEEEEKSQLSDLMTVVNSARDEGAQNQEKNKPSYVGLVAQLERQTTRAYELFETVKEGATEEEIADIERRLSDINRLFEGSKVEKTTNEEISVSELSKVLGQIQKLITFMTHLDVRQAVSLEELVPVVLSEEERIDLAKEEIRGINGLKLEVINRIEESKGTTTPNEKVTDGLVYIDELLKEAESALEIPDVSLAENTLAEARALITDLDTMTAPKAVDTIDEEEPTEEEPGDSTDDTPSPEGEVEGESSENNGNMPKGQDEQQGGGTGNQNGTGNNNGQQQGQDGGVSEVPLVGEFL